MTTEELNLVNYLIDNYGEDAIIKSSTIPNINSIYNINISILLENITDINFHKFISANYKNNDYIPVKDFIDYAIKKGNSKNTKGLYQEYMSFVFAYYNIVIKDNIISVGLLPDHIIPLRAEYMITWIIFNMVKEDKFLSKYIHTLLKPSYQKYINKKNNRYYDMSFENVDIIIEIQEVSYAHTDNINDSLKESLVKAKNKRIFYFNMSEYSEDQVDYLINALNELRIMLLQGVLTKDINIHQEYIFYKFKENIKSEIVSLKHKISVEETKSNNLKIDGLKHRLEILNIIYNDTSDEFIIKKIFKWIRDGITNENKYVISLDDVYNLLKIDNNNNKKILLKQIFENGNYDKIDNEIKLDWNGILKIIMITNLCNHNMKTILLNYLTNVKELFEIINQYIQQHYESYVSFNKSNKYTCTF